jgi:hypothetical protein
MESHHPGEEGSPIFDNLDIDLFVKAFANTAFSENYLPISAAVINHSLGPFFVFFIPIFYVFQGAKLKDPIIITSSIYYVLVSAFCGSRNPANRSQLTGPQGSRNGIQNCTATKEGSFLAHHLLTGVNKSFLLLAVRSRCQVIDTDLSPFPRRIWYRRTIGKYSSGSKRDGCCTRC